MRRLGSIAITCVLGAALVAGCSDDKKTGTTTADGGGGITTPVATGTPVSIIAADTSDTAQYFTLDTASVKTGPVTFNFENTGNRKHEMVVLKTDTPFDQLVVAADNRVSEDDSVGEIGETDAGKKATVTLDLAPGKYVLVCNIEKHYTQGMKVAFTVTA
jgi:uncharacterized cupredoxin-like copper-binding protein